MAGKLHREDGPAVECKDGHEAWYLNGKLHREGGPAVEWITGDKEWYVAGNLHREEGPAVEWANGRREWWLNGRNFKSKETWFKALNKEAKMKAVFSEHFIKG